MKIKMSKRSKINLSSGLDYRLVHLVCEAINRYDFKYDWSVFETKRTIEKQKDYFKKGTTKTMNSKHIPDGKGIVRAMDIVPWVNGRNTWEPECFEYIIPIFKELANELYPNQIEFGYDWGWDAPHIQIRKGYEL